MALTRVLVLSVVALLLVQCNADGPSITEGAPREAPKKPSAAKPEIPVNPNKLSQRERIERENVGAPDAGAAKAKPAAEPPKAPAPPVQEEPAKQPPKKEAPKQEPPKVPEKPKGASPSLKSMADDDKADERITAAAVAKKAEQDVKRAEEKEVLARMKEDRKAEQQNRRDDHNAASAAAKERLDKKLYEGGQVGDRKLGSRTETTAELAMKATEDARARAASARQKVADRINGARSHHNDITQRGRRFQEGLKSKTDGFKERIASQFNKISAPPERKDDL